VTTGRELVRKAVLFEGPERIPRDLPEPWGSDFLWVRTDAQPGWTPKIPGEDEWGCVWQKPPTGKTMGQVVHHPLSDYGAMADFAFPKYDNPERYVSAAAEIGANAEGKFVLGNAPFSLIHRLEYLRGHVEGWTDPYTHPEELGRLLDKLADVAIDSARQLARIGVDGFFSCDDWGLQDRPMMSPELFREFFKPRYARVYRTVRELGMLTILHSCGHITELLDDLIEADLQVIQMDQQENMGVDELAGRFGGKLCFWCPVDIQKTMVSGSPGDIRNHARKLIESFGRFNGGFMAKWYPDPESAGHTQERISAMCEAFVKYGGGQ
jgi:uroporphyrinogen decarboxylase